MTTLTLDSFHPHPFPDGNAPSLAPPDPAILSRNLTALARSSARTAELVRYSAPRTDLRFLHTDDDALTIETVDPIGLSPPRALASRRRPLREGELLADTVDVMSTAAVAVMGFGVGHHVATLAKRMRRTGIIAVFEPDVSLLRAVLERVDHSQWIAESNTVIFTDPDDSASISAALTGVEGIVMMGLALLEHAPSLDRLGDAKTRFYKNFQDVIAAVRTSVATTMVQVKTTVSNVVRNLPWYVSAPGIADLARSRADTPAIVVSAGPSLQRNIEQLARPGVRDRFTIIAAQTVLKPLLLRGIKPHYVVALDHSEISARFYEGLTRDDVNGITLVIEPKVSPAVPLAFPGEVRLARDPFLDVLLGTEMARDMGVLPPGATVAHLAYYLARYLGADPVVLVGQDLGFTDGQYYAAGASIHDVWACELNQFNSLERMEWERIKRMGAHLRRSKDHLGRDIFTDEQLATYLVQFERDFLADSQRGLTIIDATEGGVAKRHTRVDTLANVIDRTLASSRNQTTAAAPRPAASRVSLRRAEDRVRDVQRSVHRVAELSRKTQSLLADMLANHADQNRVGRLIDDVHRVRDEVESLKPAIDLVHYVNQTGGFSRLRADRAIQLDASLTPLQRQRREIERDIANVELLAQTADGLAAELAAAADILVRRQSSSHQPANAATPFKALRPYSPAAGSAAHAHAMIPVPAVAPEVGFDRVLGLRLTVQRLARSQRIDSIVLLAEDADAVNAAVAELSTRVPVRVIRSTRLFGDAHRLVLAARAPALDSWRGGLAGASVYDEVFAPEAMLHAMRELELDNALLVGPDWCFIDPSLCDEVIARTERAHGAHRFGFSQAPPGAAGIALSRKLIEDINNLRRSRSPFATIGGLLSYLPTAPSIDPIGRDACAPIDPAVRDLGFRLIPDAAGRAAWMSRVINSIGPERAVSLDADELYPMLAAEANRQTDAPGVLSIELEASSRLSPPQLDSIVRWFAAASSHGSLITLHVDPVAIDDAKRAIEMIRGTSSLFIHVRTTSAPALALLDSQPDIISVDLPDPREVSAWDAAHRDLDALVTISRSDIIDGRPRTWIVPRLTKCDASYPVLEGFYDRWLFATSAASIEPLAQARAGERISPLPLSHSAQRRFDRTCMFIRADASVHAADHFTRAAADSFIADASTTPPSQAWQMLRQARAERNTNA